MALIGLNSTDCVTALRNALGDLDTSLSGRFSNNVLLQWIDSANKRLVGETLFPDSRIEQPTVANVQLYQFPLMLKSDVFYVGGQIVVPSDKATLEGRQINVYDSSGDGSQLPAPYADVPSNSSSGIAAPAWTVTSPLSYPTTQGQWITPKPDAEPWYCGSPPRLYWKGGWLGLVPIPGNDDPVTTIAIEGVRQPDTIDALDIAMTTPENYKDAIVWGAIAWAKFADAGQLSEAQCTRAENNYIRERRRLIEWRGLYPGEQRDGPKVNTLRPMYAGYHMRRNRGGLR